MASITTYLNNNTRSEHTEKTLELSLATVEYGARERNLSPREVYVTESSEAYLIDEEGEVTDLCQAETLEELNYILENLENSPYRIESKNTIFADLEFRADDSGFSDQLEAKALISGADLNPEPSAQDYLMGILEEKQPEDKAWERKMDQNAENYPVGVEFLFEHEPHPENEYYEEAKGMEPFNNQQLDRIKRRLENNFEYVDDVEIEKELGIQVKECPTWEQPAPSATAEIPDLENLQ